MLWQVMLLGGIALCILYFLIDSAKCVSEGNWINGLFMFWLLSIFFGPVLGGLVLGIAVIAFEYNPGIFEALLFFIVAPFIASIILTLFFGALLGPDKPTGGYSPGGGSIVKWERTYHYDANGKSTGYSEKYKSD